MKNHIRFVFILLITFGLVYAPVSVLIPPARAATTYYAIHAGGNWSAGGTWSTISAKNASRVGGSTQPTAADTCVLDDYSGDVTVNTTTSICVALNATGYTGTLTFTAGQKLTVNGAVTLGSGMTLAGTGTMDCRGSGNLTSNGKTFPGALSFTGIGSSYTLVDNWTVTGLLTVSQAVGLAGNQFICNGGLELSGSSTGTTKYSIRGGTWSGASYSGPTNPIDLQGNVIVSSDVSTNGVLTYVSGTITVTGSNLVLGNNATLNTTGMTWNNITWYAMYNPNTLTLQSNLAVGGTITCGNLTMAGAYDITTVNMIFYGSASRTLTLVSGQTLNVTGNLTVGLYTPPLVSHTIKSTTASSAAFINHSGAYSAQMILGAIMTDITATGNTLYNVQGGTLTRCTGVINVSYPLASAGLPFFGAAFMGGIN